jgi:hypothetical protein
MISNFMNLENLCALDVGRCNKFLDCLILTLPNRLLKITRELFEQKGFDERNEFISVSQV